MFRLKNMITIIHIFAMFFLSIMYLESNKYKLMPPNVKF